MRGKMLEAIVLGSLIALGGCGINFNELNLEKQRTVQSQNQIKRISGRITHIKRGSLTSAGIKFEFENMRIKVNGEIYKLLFPGPSAYQVGDKVNFRYREETRISYEELVEEHFEEGFEYLGQRGYFDKIDGIVIR